MKSLASFSCSGLSQKAVGPVGVGGEKDLRGWEALSEWEPRRPSLEDLAGTPRNPEELDASAGPLSALPMRTLGPSPIGLTPYQTRADSLSRNISACPTPPEHRTGSGKPRKTFGLLAAIGACFALPHRGFSLRPPKGSISWVGYETRTHFTDGIAMLNAKCISIGVLLSSVWLRIGGNGVSVNSMYSPVPYGCGSKPTVPFWGRCTTHFSLF